MIRSKGTYSFLSFTAKTLFNEVNIASCAFLSTSLCVRRGESENNINGIKVQESNKNSTSIQQSWANSILDKVKRRESEGKLLRRFAGTDSKTKVVYRRRKIEDMSWTKEPMDDKLIWVDCEMTGLDHNKEMIMEIGCIITNSELGEIARQPSIIIHVPEESLKGMGPWCVKQHGNSGLTEACRQSLLTSEEVDDQLLQFVQKFTKKGECPMAGNSIYMDKLFISKQFPKFQSHFHYRIVDVSSIKELVRRWYPEEYNEAPKKKWSHRVIDDIIDSIAELKYYRSAVFRETTELNSVKANSK